MQFSAQQQFLLEDQAFLLESRGLIRLRGVRAEEALQPLICTSLDKVTKKPVLAHVLDDNGFLMIDCFVVSYQEDLLLECDKSLISRLLERLSPHCEALDVSARDVSVEWQVFAQLPDQNTFDDGSVFIKYVDPRWHMGTRLLRPANAISSSQWGSETKWATHAFKLGFLPSAALLQSVSVSPLEAGLHAMNLLDMNWRLEGLQVAPSSPMESSPVVENPPVENLSHRLLPMRIEPNSFSFPTMAGGLPVLAGDLEIGKAVGHHGLFALALINLDAWRNALAIGTPLHCAGQPVLITWPSWLAQESCGRGGPVAMSS
jgi:hypothetical protein|tara:strand:+ start:2312 stop:3262 length:951 start_codon:yes stop_codon:yes gene_type:complete